jgi:acid phosphatase type 7
MLLQGTVGSRPPVNRSQAHPGIHPVSPLTHRTQRFQPLPPPLGEPPYHYNLKMAIPDLDQRVAAAGNKLILHTVGDTGGIKHPEYQRAVAGEMKSDLNKPAGERPFFFYHLGDVVYYNGQHTQYYEQFYEPYDHYAAPIFSIPGNHDGDPAGPTQLSLDGWVEYFMTVIPHVDPESHDAPRVTMSQPNVYFTLECPFATIVGMYTNVPEGGSIDSVQQQWLTHELFTAPQDRALIVSLHHPIYSFDDHHSGSPRMADALQQAINDSRRVPNLVLTAHVHNYQRIERTIIDGSVTPFLVAGLGGYYHLHGMNVDADIGDDETGARLIKSDHKHHGYVTLTIDAETISGNLTTVGNDPADTDHLADQFEYSAAAQFLAEDIFINL